jgi:hypothetical protein
LYVCNTYEGDEKSADRILIGKLKEKKLLVIESFIITVVRTSDSGILIISFKKQCTGM